MKKIKASKVKAAVSAPVSEDDWQAKNHAQTIIDAHEIMNDPAKMAKVKKHLKAKKQAFKSIDDVIKYRNAKYSPSANDGETVGE